MPYVPKIKCQKPQTHVTLDSLTTVRNKRNTCSVSPPSSRPQSLLSGYKKTQHMAAVGYVGQVWRLLGISQVC